MATGDFKLGKATIKRGERGYVELPITSLYTHTPLSMPVYVIHGRYDGPVIFVSAAIHGDEINGVEIIRRLIRCRCLRSVHGTILLIPVVNMLGFLGKSRYLPDRRDLNRCFPGSEHGSLGSQLAHQFLHDIALRCNYGIDLHTAAQGRTNLPQVRVWADHDLQLLELAQAFKTPVILRSDIQEGTLRESCDKHGVKTLLYEAGEALRFDEMAIRTGYEGVLRVLTHLQIIQPKNRRRSKITPIIAHRNHWIRASQSGIVRSHIHLGQTVKAGEVLGYLGDPFGDTEQKIIANLDGIIIGQSTMPLIHEGEALFHIAAVDDTTSANSTLNTFQHELELHNTSPLL